MRSLPQLADIVVTGTVRDGEKDEVLPGVSVAIKGTTRGTTTDSDGKFQVAVPDNSAVLVFSFVGYQPQQVDIGNQTSLTIRLKPDAKSLDEIVVVGYGKQAKSQVIGSIAQIDGEKINNRPVPQLAQSLTGAIAGGVAIIQRSGQPGNSGG